MFIFGDLNYRIDLPNEIVRPALERREYHKLKDHDELIKFYKEYKESTDSAHVLYREFMEGEISFPPTYKYDRKSNKYDSSKKQRVPSWCDRILWRVNNKVIQQVFSSIQEVTFSDHRPVFAQFEVYTQKLNQEKAHTLEQEFYEKMRFQSVAAFGKPTHNQAIQKNLANNYREVRPALNEVQEEQLESTNEQAKEDEQEN